MVRARREEEGGVLLVLYIREIAPSPYSDDRPHTGRWPDLNHSQSVITDRLWTWYGRIGFKPDINWLKNKVQLV